MTESKRLIAAARELCDTDEKHVRDSLGRERPKKSKLAGVTKEKRSRLAQLRGISPRAAQPAPAAAIEGAALLAVKNLRVEFLTNGKWLPVMEGANFSVERGKTLGLVGESGSGLTLPEKQMRSVRGNQIAMIFQEPMTSLNPAYTVGNQIAEQVRTHRHLSKADSWKVAVEMLERVDIPHAATRARDYPHAFSGGMRQRVMIAMALSCSPKLLIADEPTTALDVTTQAQIVALLHSLQREENMAMIFVTHDLGVIADVADDVAVMYAGQIVERGAGAALFTRPRHPYSEALLNSIPQLTPPGEPLHYIPGMVPRPDQFPRGCRFHPRCSYATEACITTPVELRPPAHIEGNGALSATSPSGEGDDGAGAAVPGAPETPGRYGRRSTS